jgi:unsaturated chondroitin disaccharide hydrolase
MKHLYSIGLVLFLGGCSAKISQKAVLQKAERQTDLMVTELELAKAAGKNLVSPRTLENGQLKLVASKDWTSGFFPGELWYLYELSHQNKWKALAQKYTAPIEQEKLNGVTHDMGFKIYSSVGNGYRLTGDPHYKEVLIQAAGTLSTRFNPKVGLIRSWDHHSAQWAYPVIIDNMINLELLFEATKLTGDSSYYKIAVSHADKTMKNHFRADFSTFHVVSYNPQTGEVEKKQTHQGYSDASAWARGQAWALYGYTVCYRETKNPAYLKQAEGVAQFIFNNPHLPKDLVPYWDYDAPGIPNEPRDVSAATVTASALYELSTYSRQGAAYLQIADTIMGNLAKSYTAANGGSRGFILVHSTGSKPQNSEVDVPLSYADYYYLEALVRKKKLERKEPVI